MGLSVLIAMFVFSLAMSITPGPVNMVILSSGVNYGAKRTIPYVSGATIGFTLLLLCIGLGFYQLIQAHPDFLTYLSRLGSLYIAYIGYKIVMSKPVINVQEQNIPKFYEGFVLQWINPKAWIACVTGATLFSQTDSYGQFLIFAGIYFLVCYASLGVWAVVGQWIASILKNPVYLRVFNIVMGGMLIVSSIYLVLSNKAII